MMARVFHAFAVFVAAALVALLLLFVLACVALHVECPEWLMPALGWTTSVIVLASAVVAIRCRVSPRGLTPVIAGCAAVVVYLVWDDREAPPAPQGGRLAAADSALAATCGWLVKDGPKNRLAEQDVEKLKLPSYPKERDDWAEFLVQNRAAFESAWAQDRLGREWVETMAVIPADGLLPPPTTTGGIMSFEPLRKTSQIRWGIAQLQLADGQADEAARTLIPLLRATYHLQRSAPSLVNQMIAVVILQGTYERLDLVLGSGRVSPEVRSALAVALRECPGTDLPIANAFYGEKSLAWGVSEGLSQPTRNLVDWQGEQAHVPWMGWPGIWRMYFNPHRTERMYLKFLDDACVRAQRRQFTAASDVCTPPRRSPLPIKNPCGATFADLVTPTFDKVFEHFWKVEDERVALLRRLS